MDPRRWQRIEELYHSALQRSPELREDFLAAECRDDSALYREVQDLLARDEEPSAMLDRPAWERAAAILKTVELQAGTMLGPYRILGALGSGGMGTVYQAEDTRLRRKVAIKLLRSHAAGSPGMRQRFEREAQAISALNHPHICAVHDIGSQDGADYLVMEHLEGETLAARLRKGALSFPAAMAIAAQVADALGAAHGKGIVHRDLKPENIMLTAAGPKILDFGLAKIAPAPVVAGTSTVTQTEPLTTEGAIMGTLPYMAPEQVEGKQCDNRTDIFAFGLVLYEMLAGRRAFPQDTKAGLIAAVISSDPDFGAIRTGANPQFERVLRGCLEKEPAKRWQSILDVKRLLEWPAGAPVVRAKRAWLPALVTLIALGLAGGWMFLPQTEQASHVTILEAPLPENATLGSYVSLSTDGRKLVFAGAGSQGVLWIRDLDTLEWRQLPGTEGGGSPFWSPDGRILAFGAGNQLKKTDIAGGPPQTLCTVPTDAAGSGTWNRDGVIVFGSTGGGSGGPLWKISQAGGAATAITEVDASRGESYHSLPSFMPDGKHFIYFRSGTPEVEGVYAGSLNAKPGEQSRERILAGRFGATYVNGYLFFMRENTLMAQPFDAGRLQVRAEPVPMAERVVTTWYNTGIFSVSPSGALAYRATAQSGSFQLTWLDRKGKTLNTVGQPTSDQGIWLSPDGTRGVVRETRGESTGSILTGRSTGNLWTIDIARGLRTRLTFRQSAGSFQSVWSPDGSRIAFAAGNLLDTLYEKASSGAGDEKELLKEPGRIHSPTSWSVDGRFLLYYVANMPKTGYDVYLLPLQGDRKPVLLLGGVFNEWGARFSPDMRWITYASTETGDSEVYVRPFKAVGPSGAPSLGEGKWQVSRCDGNWPRWRADGKEIIFTCREFSPSGRMAMMAVEVKTNGAAFEYGDPQQLFEGPVNNGWDVTPDGRRFLLSASQIRQTGQIPITVMLDWRARLKK